MTNEETLEKIKNKLIEEIKFCPDWKFTRSGVIDIIKECVDEETTSEIIDLIKELPTVTPTNEDMREAYIKGYDYGVKDWFKSKTQPCEDCISILNRIMEYTYGMLTAEKYGLQHLIKSMMDELSGGGEEGRKP